MTHSLLSLAKLSILDGKSVLVTGGTGSFGRAFVERVEVAGRFLLAPGSPRLSDERELGVAEVGDRSHVLRRVDDDLLPLERRVEVRHDADAPRVPDRQRLGRRAVLAPGAERAALELRLGRRIDERPAGTGPLRASWCNDDLATRERVDAELSAQLPSRTNGLIRSIGAGKTIVVDAEGPSSSSVCR